MRALVVGFLRPLAVDDRVAVAEEDAVPVFREFALRAVVFFPTFFFVFFAVVRLEAVRPADAARVVVFFFFFAADFCVVAFVVAALRDVAPLVDFLPADVVADRVVFRRLAAEERAVVRR